MTFQEDLSREMEFLRNIIKTQGTAKELDWINHQENKFLNNFELRSFYISFSSASRFIRKNRLQLSEKQLADAEVFRKGFQPQYWNMLQCVRTYLLLMIPSKDVESYKSIFTKLQETADIEEQVALYNALPILPYPVAFIKQTTEGVRTNITDVFDAIALNNPFPANYLEQPAWNQMFLKAVFMQRPLYRIYGADERANPELAGMLIDFAHERWAANRMVLPELWRFVGPFLDKTNIADIEKVIHGEPLEKKAGLLACAQSEFGESQHLLNQYPRIKRDIESGKVSWSAIGEKYQDELQK